MASSKTWVRLAGLSGASSVGMAAYGAHGVSHLDSQFKMVFDNGNKLHMAHSMAVLAGASSVKCLRAPSLTLGLFTAGIGLFAGSCYGAALTENRSNGRLAPVGGTALIAAWLSLIP